MTWHWNRTPGLHQLVVVRLYPGLELGSRHGFCTLCPQTLLLHLSSLCSYLHILLCYLLSIVPIYPLYLSKYHIRYSVLPQFWYRPSYPILPCVLCAHWHLSALLRLVPAPASFLYLLWLWLWSSELSSRRAQHMSWSQAHPPTFLYIPYLCHASLIWPSCPGHISRNQLGRRRSCWAQCFVWHRIRFWARGIQFGWGRAAGRSRRGWNHPGKEIRRKDEDGKGQEESSPGDRKSAGKKREVAARGERKSTTLAHARAPWTTEAYRKILEEYYDNFHETKSKTLRE